MWRNLRVFGLRPLRLTLIVGGLGRRGGLLWVSDDSFLKEVSLYYFPGSLNRRFRIGNVICLFKNRKSCVLTSRP